MGQQQQQTLQKHGQEMRDSADENPREGAASNDYEQMISPVSLLRSDRFAKTKPVTSLPREPDITRGSDHFCSSREDAARISVSIAGYGERTTTPINQEATRGRATIPGSDQGIICSSKLKKRGKVPAKLRGATARLQPPTRCALDPQRPTNCSPAPQSPTRCSPGHNEEQTANVSHLAVRDSSFYLDSSLTSPNNDSSMLLQTIARMDLVGSEYQDYRRSQISQSPLRPSSAPSPREEAHFQRSPRRSPESPDHLATKTAESTAWSSRCSNLKQQITEHLRACNTPYSADRQISTSPIRTVADRSPPSRTTTSHDWIIIGQRTLPDPAVVSQSFVGEFRNRMAMDRLSQALEHRCSA